MSRGFSATCYYSIRDEQVFAGARILLCDDGAAGTVLDDVQELAIHTPRLTLEVVVIPCQKSIAPSITLVHAR